MRLKLLAVLLVGVLAAQVCYSISQASAQSPAGGEKATTAPATAPATGPVQISQVSYGIGVELARNFKREGVDVDPDMLAKGLKDVAAGGKLLMTDEEMAKVMSAYRVELMQKQEKMRAAAVEKNAKEGEAFLAKNKTQEGVVTLPSGLQYKIIKAGDGKKPAATDTVECQYRGTLIDGTEFDSSSRYGGTPVSLNVSQVIPGWQEALQLMPVGSKWMLYIPSQLAYGAQGAGREIGPNATLIFELELVAVK
jgi:FKBP-type peptidyl-prolyl cis-trans isomerase FklB